MYVCTVYMCCYVCIDKGVQLSVIVIVVGAIEILAVERHVVRDAERSVLVSYEEILEVVGEGQAPHRPFTGRGAATRALLVS